MWYKSDAGGWDEHDWRWLAQSENSRNPQTNNNVVLPLFAHLSHFVCFDISLLFAHLSHFVCFDISFRAYQCHEQ
jgi:hypothetical protein